MLNPLGAWYTDEQWAKLSPHERALQGAALDAKTGVREIGGANRGKRVEEYLRSVGLGGGYAWCAAFVTFWMRQAGATKAELARHPASACSWIHQSPYSVTSDVKQVSRGDLFAWCDQKKWQGHIGFVVKAHRILGIWFIDTIEGNTNDAGSREGDGVYRKRRRVTSNMRFILTSKGVKR